MPITQHYADCGPLLLVSGRFICLFSLPWHVHEAARTRGRRPLIRLPHEGSHRDGYSGAEEDTSAGSHP